MGPTASGKTDLAVEMVDIFPFEIVSVDSVMIYREMNIGSAKPTPSELAKAAHHLIDLINPNEAYSAARFCEDAERVCQMIRQKGKIPLLVGGTMMYFKALQQGLSSLPASIPELRQAILERAQEKGWPFLHHELSRIDPKSAAQIHANDAQRIGRALEVYELSGKTMTEHLQENDRVAKAKFINLSLFPNDRAWLHQRIQKRFSEMLAEGLIEEVRDLIGKWTLTEKMPSMRAVGYRQVFDFLQGKFPESALFEKGAAATRQLAKRQLTWLRHWQDIHHFEPSDKIKLLETVKQFIYP
jgi:tRNA dimethylallyltransferase